VTQVLHNRSMCAPPLRPQPGAQLNACTNGLYVVSGASMVFLQQQSSQGWSQACASTQPSHATKLVSRHIDQQSFSTGSKQQAY